MYILNKDNKIKEKLKAMCNDFDNLYIAVSFITERGLNEIVDIESIGKKVSLITTTDEFITEPKILRKLHNNGVNVFVINKNSGSRGFHSKFIISEKNGKLTSLMGSLNITNESINRKYETVFVNSDSYSEELLGQFKYLIAHSEKIDKDFIDQYEIKYTFFQSELKANMDRIETSLNLQANEMQARVLEEINNLRSSGNNKALLHAATGTGKTILSALDIKNNKFKKVLFIVHSRLIIKNAIRDYRNIFFDKNILELDSKSLEMVEEYDFVFSTQIAVKNALIENPNFLENFDYFIFDEAHKIGPENTMGRILDMTLRIKSSFTLAMSATPKRTDQPYYVLNKFIGCVVGNIDLKTAIEKKLICKFKYDGVDIDESIDFNLQDLNHNDLEIMLKAFFESLNKKRVWDNTKVKGIIFTKNTNEAENVSRMINSNYLEYNSVAIHSNSKGLMNRTQENKISTYLDRLQNEADSLNFIVAVDMFNEGVDIPRINTIGMFRFTNSNIIYTQQIGRGLRKENSHNKYLNIIDLVGNHKGAHHRMAGISSNENHSPSEHMKILFELNKKISSRAKNKDYENQVHTIDECNKKENNIINNIDIELSEISMKYILESLKENVSYRKYFKNAIRDNYELTKINPKLIDIEDKLKSDIGIIVNNLKVNRQYNVKENKFDKSWLQVLHDHTGNPIKNIKPIESGLIELFSWMPLTTTTPDEKRMILKILEKEHVEIEEKWLNYFLSNKTENQWTIVRGDYSQFFEVENNIIKFNDKNLSRGAKELLDEIKEYLRKNLSRNDYLQKKWYSKIEVAFMAGHGLRKLDALISDSKESELFVANNIDSEYSNDILSREESLISTKGMKPYDTEKIYRNFMGKKTFHKYAMFLYLGEQNGNIEFDSKRNKSNGPGYLTYKFKSTEPMNEIDYFYFEHL